MYSKIVNPETGRKVSIYGKLGKKIINHKTYADFTNAKKIASKLKINFIPIIKPIKTSLKSLDQVVYSKALSYLL